MTSPSIRSTILFRVLLLAAAVTIAAGSASGQQKPVRPFWPEIARFLQQDEAAGLTRCRTLFVGSSSIRFWVDLERDMAGRPVVRRGFGGAHLRHVIFYFEALIARHRPREIVLYAGENDISWGRAPGDVLADLEAFMQLKRQALGATPVYFISIKPSIYRWQEYRRQGQANALVKRHAEANGDLVFVDVASAMVANGQPKAIFAPDGLHMNRDGYALWTRAVSDALDRSGVPVARDCR